MKDIFSPQSYLKQATSNRRRRVRKTLFGVGVIALIITGISSTVGYYDLLSTGLVEAAQRFDAKIVQQPEPQALERPDERENTYEEITFPLGEELEAEESAEDDEYIEEEYDYVGENGCNVLGLSITGEIGTDYGDTTSNAFRDTLEEYSIDERIKAILVEVDSGGGSAVAGDEIAKLLEEQAIPVIAQIREVGASAAYMAILPVDTIFAHRWASIGSIGVIIPFYDYTKFNEKQGIKYTPILSSPSKDAGTTDRALTKEERKTFQAEINFVYEGFIRDVAKYRGLTVDKVRSVADGTTMIAHEAKDAGLIDEIGGRAEVLDHLRTTLAVEPVVCWEANLEY